MEIMPEGLKVGIIHADRGGEFDGWFKFLLTEYWFKLDPAPPYTRRPRTGTRILMKRACGPNLRVYAGK